jgi:hypothetical protein
LRRAHEGERRGGTGPGKTVAVPQIPHGCLVHQGEP